MFHADTDLKVLLLFIMRKLGKSATLDELVDLSTNLPGTSEITYFDVASNVDSLVQTEHLTHELDEYTLTKKGIRNGEITEDGVTYSVRVHAERAAVELRNKRARQELVRTSRMITRRGGFTTELTLLDGRDEVMSLRLNTVSEEQSARLEAAFSERAEILFAKIMEELAR